MPSGSKPVQTLKTEHSGTASRFQLRFVFWIESFRLPGAYRQVKLRGKSDNDQTMTNPASDIKVLITYAVCIQLAILVGYTLTDPLDYGTLGIFGLIALLLLSPVFIKWHYPIMLFGLAAPIYCFFLKGNPPLGQVVVLLSFRDRNH